MIELNGRYSGMIEDLFARNIKTTPMKKWFDVDAIFKLFLHKALQLEKREENPFKTIKMKQLW